ncbi:MAG: hypothetical protein ABSG83_02295 [Roseiarcus sp.]|jgi:hypothetical protein
MTIRSKRTVPGRSIAALALAAGLIALGAKPAGAQWFRWPGWDPALSPAEVERMIEASGYRLTGPVLRDGPLYLANVLGREDDLERLVIDARDGRLLQRYAAASGYRRLAAAGAWSNRPRVDAAPNDGWLDRDDDAPPRPPAFIDGGGEGAPRLSLPQPKQIARGDDAAFPRVILAPPGASEEPAVDKPKPKPQAKRKRPDASPVAQPAPNPNPAAPAHADAAAGTSPPAAAGVADTKPALEIVASPPVAPAAPQAVAPAPNDVPVAPLE